MASFLNVNVLLDDRGDLLELSDLIVGLLANYVARHGETRLPAETGSQAPMVNC